MALTDREQELLEPLLERIRDQVREHGDAQYNPDAPGLMRPPLPSRAFWEHVASVLRTEGYVVDFLTTLLVRKA